MTKSFFIGRAALTLALFVFSLSLHAQQFQGEIKTYLQEVKSKWKLTSEDIANWTISDQYTDRETGITYTYLHQQIAGVRIFNAVSTVAIRDGKVAYFANRFHAKAAQRANNSTPVIGAEAAIQAAAAHLGITLTEALQLQKEEPARRRLFFTNGGISKEAIRAELVYVPVEGQLRLAWNVNIAPKTSTDWWNIRIDAQNGSFLEKNNWNVSCDFGHEHPAGTSCQSKSATEKTVFEKQENVSGAAYNVFPLPLEAPNFGSRSLLTDPELLLASPFGWHDTTGVAGPEFTITRGNNVYAYEDENDTNEPGYSPDGGSNLQFDFPLDLGQAPEVSRDAIVTNLFYMNNMLHDILYRHGFDEVAGNFQQNNYGKGGNGDDYVLAEAQDGGGTNNANFATPDDGFSGRMQMYLWLSGAPALLIVHAPADIAGEYSAVESSFGPDIATPVSSEIVLYDDDNGTTTDACEAAINAFEIAGKIAVVDRGNCNFIDKVQNAEAAGAIAVIVVNNSPASPISMSGNGFVGIPSVMISQANGNLLKAKLNSGEKVSVTLSKVGGASPDRDGSLDNGIIAHEYGHGLSNRLTGGPSNSDCLFNDEQGGEGWSDWLALILTIEPGDAGTDSRGIGTYALDDTTGVGIRRFPYSTDMGINGQVYGDLANSSGPHAVGEIWSQTLWDMTWKLIDAEGFDPDWYNGNGGNNTAMRLVLQGMKLQPCGPGYLDARDAILAADEMLYGNAHRCLIWEAFAGRGMGFNANQGSPNQTGDETQDFTLPTFCQDAIVPPVANFTVDVQTSCFGTFTFKDQSTDIPQNWLWDFGDGNTSTAINPIHTYATPGIYTVKLSVTNTLGMDDYSLTVQYETLPIPAVTGDTAVCAGNPAALTADVVAGNTATWSTGGAVVHTGATYNITSIQNTTTYTVRQLEEKPIGKVGPVNNTFGGGGNHNTGFEGRLLFEAFVPFKLLSVQVYAQGAGERTIRLYNASNQIVQEIVVPVPNGSSRIDLNMEIPSPGLYSIGSQNFYRNNSGANYPYVLDNVVRIYSSNATDTELSFYYYFYDWEVQEIGCASEPVAYTVNVTPGPVAAFTTATDDFTVTFSDATTGNATSWLWNFGDGSPVSTVQNPVHTYAEPGTYTVVLSVSNGVCSSTFEQTVVINSTSLNNPGEAFGMNVFPNPASQQVNIEIYQTLTGPISLQITDAIGRVVLEEKYAPSTTRISINTTDFAPGAYAVRVKGKEGSATRKVTILR